MPVPTEELLKQYLRQKVAGFNTGEWRGISNIEIQPAPGRRGNDSGNQSVLSMEIGKGKMSKKPGISVGPYHLVLGDDGQFTLLNKCQLTITDKDKDGNPITNYKVIQDPKERKKVFDGVFAKLLSQPNIEKELKETQIELEFKHLMDQYAVKKGDGWKNIAGTHLEIGVDRRGNLSIATIRGITPGYHISKNGSDITVFSKDSNTEIKAPEKFSILEKCLRESGLSQTFGNKVEETQQTLDEDNALDLLDLLYESSTYERVSVLRNMGKNDLINPKSFNAEGYPSIEANIGPNTYKISSGVDGHIKVFKDNIEIKGDEAKNALRKIMKPFDAYNAASIERTPNSIRSKSGGRGGPGVEIEHKITTSMEEYLKKTEFPGREQPHYKQYRDQFERTLLMLGLRTKEFTVLSGSSIQLQRLMQKMFRSMAIEKVDPTKLLNDAELSPLVRAFIAAINHDKVEEFLAGDWETLNTQFAPSARLSAAPVAKPKDAIAPPIIAEAIVPTPTENLLRGFLKERAGNLAKGTWLDIKGNPTIGRRGGGNIGSAQMEIGRGGESGNLGISIGSYHLALNGNQFVLLNKCELDQDGKYKVIHDPLKRDEIFDSILLKIMSEPTAKSALQEQGGEGFVGLQEEIKSHLDEQHALDLINKLAQQILGNRSKRSLEDLIRTEYPTNIENSITAFGEYGKYPSIEAEGCIITSSIDGKLRVLKNDIDITDQKEAKDILRRIMKPFDDHYANSIEKTPAFRTKGGGLRGGPVIAARHALANPIRISATSLFGNSLPTYTDNIHLKQYAGCFERTLIMLNARSNNFTVSSESKEQLDRVLQTIYRSFAINAIDPKAYLTDSQLSPLVSHFIEAIKEDRVEEFLASDWEKLSTAFNNPPLEVLPAKAPIKFISHVANLEKAKAITIANAHDFVAHFAPGLIPPPTIISRTAKFIAGNSAHNSKQPLESIQIEFANAVDRDRFKAMVLPHFIKWSGTTAASKREALQIDAQFFDPAKQLSKTVISLNPNPQAIPGRPVVAAPTVKPQPSSADLPQQPAKPATPVLPAGVLDTPKIERFFKAPTIPKFPIFLTDTETRANTERLAAEIRAGTLPCPKPTMMSLDALLSLIPKAMPKPPGHTPLGLHVLQGCDSKTVASFDCMNGAIRQAASQFNNGEATDRHLQDPSGFIHDRTQGPSEQRAAGGAALARYAHQAECDCFAAILNDPLLNQQFKELFDYQFGYLTPRAGQEEKGLLFLQQHINKLALNVERVPIDGKPGQTAIQVLNAGLALGDYDLFKKDRPPGADKALKEMTGLLLTKQYQAVAAVGILEAIQHPEKRVPISLTLIGGGVFGNDPNEIAKALSQTIKIIKDSGVTNIDICLSVFKPIELSALKKVAAQGDEFKDLRELLNATPITPQALKSTGLPTPAAKAPTVEPLHFPAPSRFLDLSNVADRQAAQQSIRTGFDDRATLNARILSIPPKDFRIELAAVKLFTKIVNEFNPAQPPKKPQFLSEDVLAKVSQPFSRSTTWTRNADLMATNIRIGKRIEKPTGGDEKVMVVSLANAFEVGGHILRARAQEEAISHNTTLTLLAPSDYPNTPGKAGLERLGHSYRVEGVQQFKLDGEKLVQEGPSFDLTFVAAPDFSNPSNRPTNAAERQSYIDRMAFEFRNQCEHAKASGAKKIVMGALGCGAFANNPFLVAAIARSVLCEEAYKDLKVEFAIDHNPDLGGRNLPLIFNTVFKSDAKTMNNILDNAQPYDPSLQNTPVLDANAVMGQLALLQTAQPSITKAPKPAASAVTPAVPPTALLKTPISPPQPIPDTKAPNPAASAVTPEVPPTALLKTPIIPPQPIPDKTVSARDKEIGAFINFVQSSKADNVSAIKAKAKEFKIDKEDLVAYIRKLDPKKQVTLIKNIFNPDTPLHAYFSIQRGILGTAEHRGTFKELAEILDPSLKKLNVFTRTTDKYRAAVNNIKDDQVVDPAPLAEASHEPPRKDGPS